MSTDRTALTRRTFVASAGALGALAACGTAANTLYASAPQAFGDESGDGESIDELREDKPELPTPARRGIALCHVAAVHEIPHGHPFSKSSSCTYNLRLSINPIGRGATHKLHDPSTDSHGFVHENARA
ncbi:MAG: Tat pathway signal protein [Eggerthella lenta]